MIIDCGNYRLKSYRYGWIIQKKHLNKNSGLTEWRDDRPAYPASLADGCQIVAERIFTDGDDITPEEIPRALERAVHKVREFMQIARRSA
jgi:hypothetical protein